MSTLKRIGASGDCTFVDGPGRLLFGKFDVGHSDDDFSVVLWVMVAHLSHIVTYTRRGNGFTRYGFEPNGTDVMLQNECKKRMRLMFSRNVDILLGL